MSLTTGKIYDLEGNWEEELEKDYQSSRYYSSRSWASAAGTFISGKNYGIPSNFKNRYC